MTSKWNEKLVINFLEQYKQHPCLWNPYDKRYYNCKEKNEALQKIINGLGTPGYTINDYLHRIKIIREKYKKEQRRIIKGLQSQKHYESPFPWYNIVADMLTKVISDEEKVLNAAVRKSLSNDNVRSSQRKQANLLKISPCTDATCENVSRRSKSAEKSLRSSFERNASKSDRSAKTQSKTRVKYVPFSQVRTTGSVSRDLEKDVVSSYKPTRDAESRAGGYSSTSISFVSVDMPSNGLATESNKNDEGFLRCPFCGWEGAKYKHKQVESNAEKPLQEQMHSVPCSDYIIDLPRARYTTCTNCDKDYPKKPTDDSGDYEILRDTPTQIPRPSLPSKFAEVSTESRRESHRSPVRPVRPVRPVVPSKKDVDVEVQYNKVKEIPKDDVFAHSPVQIQIVQLNPEMASQFQGSTIEACTRLKIILADSKSTSRENEFSLQSVPPQNTQGVQCNRRSTRSTKETQFSPKNILPERKQNEVNIKTVNSVEREVKNTVCVSEGSKRCVFFEILNEDNKNEKHEDKNPETDLIRSVELKEVEVNTVDKESKGIQSVEIRKHVSKGNSACCLCFEKLKDSGTTPSVHQVRNVCISSENLKKDTTDFVSCGTEFHTSLKCCIRREDSKETAEKGIQGYEDLCKTDTCPRNLLQIAKEDPSVAFMLQQLLTKILSRKSEHRIKSTKTSNSQTDYDYACNAKENCTLDVQKMVSKLKEHAIKMLESNRSLNLTPEMSKDETLALQEVTKFPVVDKEVSTYSESRDIGTNGSLLRLTARNIGIQSDTKLMNDAGSSIRHDTIGQSKISVGTQKRDPILVRVIKCNEGQMIVKSDKETLTVGTTTDREKKYIDKRIETCGRPTCASYSIRKQTKDEKLECGLRKEGKHQVDRLRAFKNFTCDKNCKDKAYCERDWTDVTNIDPFRNFNRSKTPSCVRPRKCIYATNK